MLYAGTFAEGQFRFRLWDFGKWRKVAVDDRLPTVKNQNGVNELIFARNSNQPNEFWIPLLEKAFVKYVDLFHSLSQARAAHRNKKLHRLKLTRYRQ